MQCIHCGHKLREKAKYCSSCGKKTAENTKHTARPSDNEEEKPKSFFKFQKKVSAKQYRRTALVGLIIGVILFWVPLLGSTLFLIGLFSGIAWLYKITKSKLFKVVLIIISVLLVAFIFYGLFLNLSDI